MPEIPQWVVELLNEKATHFNRPAFIENDPIQIPHRFSLQQDIEIMAFFAAILAWGQRRTIISKCTQLSALMDDAPYDFVLNHTPTDLARLRGFKHRTFQEDDLLHFLRFFRSFYRENTSLETAFSQFIQPNDQHIGPGLVGFRELFFTDPLAPARTRKHVATPMSGSACKRLAMFLRWMVRKDSSGVDFGLWTNISPAQLICPCDVHVERVAKKLGLIHHPKTNWEMALALTAQLRILDPSDPVRYDFALFGLGVEGLM